MTDMLIAEMAIRRLHARYVDALWRKDPDCFAALHAEDAEWKIAGMHLRGRDRIRAEFAKFMVHLDRSLMLFSDPIVDMGDGFASCRTYATENNKFADGRTARTIGVYYERIVEEGDGWRFKWRHWDMSYIGPPDFSAQLYEVRDYGPPPGSPGPDDPTTVRRDFLFTLEDGSTSANP